MTTFPTVRRGNTVSLKVLFSGTSGSIADCIVRFMVKRYLSDADSAAKVNLDNDERGGVTVVTATSPYELLVEIPDDVMATLPRGDLYAGIQLELPDGTTQEVEGILQKFTVLGDVVRGVASP